MTVIDELVRFIHLVPLPAKDAHIVVDALISNFTARLDLPVTLITKNGTKLTAEYFQELCSND